MHSNRGLSFFELIIVLFIMSLFIAIAIPSYNQYIISTRRSDGRIAILNLAHKLERYFFENSSFEGATLARVNMPEHSSQGFYCLRLQSITAKTYTIAAIPTDAQKNDTECATLIYNESGKKSITGSTSAENCW